MYEKNSLGVRRKAGGLFSVRSEHTGSVGEKRGHSRFVGQ